MVRRYVFASPLTAQRPLSDNAITAALRRIGYTSQQVSWHGFHAMASTLLNELGFPPDVIELQLAHQHATKCGLLTTVLSGSMNDGLLAILLPRV